MSTDTKPALLPSGGFVIETAVKITIILSCSMLCYKQKICDKEGEQMTIDLALEKMIPGMQEIYGDMVDSIILYGSTACGTRAEDLGQYRTEKI